MPLSSFSGEINSAEFEYVFFLLDNWVLVLFYFSFEESSNAQALCSSPNTLFPPSSCQGRSSMYCTLDSRIWTMLSVIVLVLPSQWGGHSQYALHTAIHISLVTPTVSLMLFVSQYKHRNGATEGWWLLSNRPELEFSLIYHSD